MIDESISPPISDLKLRYRRGEDTGSAYSIGCPFHILIGAEIHWKPAKRPDIFSI